MSDTVRYLSLAWIDELSRVVAGDDELTRLAGEHEIGVTQVVSDGPEGEVVYHLQVPTATPAWCRGGRARARAHGAVVGHGGRCGDR